MARTGFVLLAILLAAAPAARADEPDEAALRAVSAEYVRAFLACDLARFQALLAPDFRAILADGRLIDRAEFLRQAAQKPDALDLRLRELTVRQRGEAAVVAALVQYRRSDGTAVRTRYTCLCERSEGAWRISWVQWTRVAGP